ncbi:Homeobox-leucine zipper protein hdg5 [Thalictrum thalictroides]|uniref:Homeobox-leucine zipper protein hdg5 n=1 Tax=Thalictrum thalictroides TaxID=46969 RepID=A0A7J6WMU2_THATH|nr:Homeobox-leucine zipper protein hdg5 [Thalictrum thalictroides]
MFGDCQVLSTLGGNVMTSDHSSLFASPIRNPNLNFISNLSYNPFSSIIPKEEARLQIASKEDEMIESGSVSGHVEGASADEEQDLEEPQPKKKRYHRHTARQIQEMEALFKECPHPDDKQRMKLSADLGLKPRQVKFWFQNRRTQMKLERLSCVVSRCGGRPMHALGPPPPLLLPSVDLDMNIYSRHFQEQMGSCTDMIPVPPMPDNSNFAGSNLIMEQDKHMAIEFAMNAMDELMKMCQMNEPLWIPNNNGTKEMLNMEEHAKMFPWQTNLKQQHSQCRTEATRDSAVVIMNSITLVDAFLDVNKWKDIFPSIVSRAKTVQIISSGIAGHASGSLHLMHAEFQVQSPLVPTREAHFLRYCQQNAEEGTWAIVDFPIDGFHESLQHSFPRYRRRPSGCLIQDMPNGYSRITWVEHAEVEDKPVHQIFNHFVNSGTAFGAQRWLAVLQQQCERLASLMARNISDLGVIPTPEARKNLMKLSQRMIRTFCFNISTAGGQSWTAISDSAEDTVRITTRKMTEPGQPGGLILGAVSTTWLPFSHQQVFDLLRDERRRSQLDVLSSGASSHEVAHIANGAHPGNCISLLRINAASNSSQNVELMLQESSTDQFSSLVVYSTIDVDAVQLAMNGEDPSYIPLLPLGFVITPSNTIKSPENGNGPTSGCLLTVGLQVLASTIPSAKINLSNVTAINNHIGNVVHQISSALNGGVSLLEPTL